MKKITFTQKLIIAILSFMLAVIMLVVIFDPFYHYHGPVFGLKAVLTEPEYQVIGSIRNFDYDAILLGSSVAENFDNAWFDNEFGCKTVKGIKKSGTTAYLTYYLDEALESHDVKYVFYSLDVSALLADYKLDLEEEGLPMYLFDKNIITDVHYIFNKDVIFEKIPYMLVQGLDNDYKEGESYNWAKYKEFSADIALSNYNPPEEKELSNEEMQRYLKNVNDNLSEIEDRIKNNPETEFYIWIPPYSSLWQDQIERTGEKEISDYAINAAYERLSAYDNVHYYSFIYDKDITENLDNYMDPIHFSQSINYYIFEKISGK